MVVLCARESWREGTEVLPGPGILSTKTKLKFQLNSQHEQDAQNVCILSICSCCLETAVCSDPVLLVRRVTMYENVKQARSILPLGTVLCALWYLMYSVSSLYSGVSWVAWGKNEWGCWRQNCLWLSSNLWSHALLQGSVPCRSICLPLKSFTIGYQRWRRPCFV